MGSKAFAHVAIPFRVGWGFSPELKELEELARLASQSLSGWDGVFHSRNSDLWIKAQVESQSLSGWDGVFH